MKILKVKFLLFVSFILFVQSNQAQQLSKVIVLDSETRKPIEFVDVKGKNFFTYTNVEGIFEVPVSIDTLIISRLAYEKKIIVSTFEVLDTIYLKSDIMKLNEVIVSADKFNLSEYIDIENNYPFTPYVENFFLRSVLKKDGKIIKLQDLVGDLERQQLFITSSHPKPKRNLRLQILEMRKAAIKEEEVYFEMFSIEAINDIFTGIYRSPTKYNYEESSSQDSLLVKLAFSSKDEHGGTKGYYLIDEKDRAISEFFVNDMYKDNDFTKGIEVKYRNNLIEVKVSFKKNQMDSKYYIDKAKFNGTVELYNGKSKTPNIYEAEYIWIVQDIKQKDLSKEDAIKKDIFKLEHPYNSDYWKENETLSLTKDMKKFISEIIETNISNRKWTNIQ